VMKCVTGGFVCQASFWKILWRGVTWGYAILATGMVDQAISPVWSWGLINKNREPMAPCLQTICCLLIYGLHLYIYMFRSWNCST
jgi:hypothetical protein